MYDLIYYNIRLGKTSFLSQWQFRMNANVKASGYEDCDQEEGHDLGTNFSFDGVNFAASIYRENKYLSLKSIVSLRR